MNDAPACVICHTDLWADEAGRYACRPCERRIAENLASISGPRGLYARLCLRIQPAGRGITQSVTGSRGASTPASMEILNLTANGGIVSTLETWVEDWASYGLAATNTGGRLQHRVDQAVATLRLNLPRAVERHAALDEFAREVSQIKRQAEAIIVGEQGPRLIAVACPCGGTMRVTIDTPGARCPACDQQYGHAEVLQLPLAQRAAA